MLAHDKKFLRAKPALNLSVESENWGVRYTKQVVQTDDSRVAIAEPGNIGPDYLSLPDDRFSDESSTKKEVTHGYLDFMSW